MAPATNDPAGFATGVVRRLRKAGYEAFWAGGCVRDLLLGTAPKDYDVATSARPPEVCALFRRTLTVGASFGVVKILGRGGASVEVATFRTDDQYSDGRHPDSVRFSTPEEDARRRDFTINGMFFDPLTKSVHDYVGGQDDLRASLVRAIGDPHERFREDKLRILRAVRFAAGLGFALEPETARAVASMSGQLGVVSAERILVELRTMLAPPTRTRALALLRELGLFPHVFPELAEPLADQSAWDEISAVCGLDRWLPLSVVVAALTSRLPHAEALAATGALFRRLKSSNEDRQRAQWVVMHRDDLVDAAQAPFSRLKRRLAHSWAEDLLAYHEAVERAQKGSTPDVEFCRNLLTEQSPAQIDPPPLITGHDLIAMGLVRGPEFQTILRRVRDLQLEGVLTNREEALAFVRQHWC